MNYVWFASGHDSDDVPYRLLTLVQMAGVLILAAGIHDAFVHFDFTTMTIGYVVMRLGLVGMWLRVARDQPAHRRRAMRFVVGITAVQVLWLLRLALPDDRAIGVASFAVLAGVELTIPIWAERAAPGQQFHAGHLAERFGLFTIIVLGEVILSSTIAVREAIDAVGIEFDVLVVAAAALVIAFAVWWSYFGRDDEPEVDRLHGAFFWGYGHLPVYRRPGRVRRWSACRCRRGGRLGRRNRTRGSTRRHDPPCRRHRRLHDRGRHREVAHVNADCSPSKSPSSASCCCSDSWRRCTWQSSAPPFSSCSARLSRASSSNAASVWRSPRDDRTGRTRSTAIETAVRARVSRLVTPAVDIVDCDPALADTAQFCAAYGYEMEDSANAIVVIGKSDPPRFALCLVLATTRLDVNKTVRARLGTRKASFAPAETTSALTGMTIGGVTPFAVPEGLPIWVDAAVMTRRRIVVGGGSRRCKVVGPPEMLLELDGVEVIDGLAWSAD